jgi:hypothetical protein
MDGVASGRILGYVYNDKNERKPIEITNKIESGVSIDKARQVAEETNGAQAIVSTKPRDDDYDSYTNSKYNNDSSVTYDVYNVKSEKNSKEGVLPKIDFVNNLEDVKESKSPNDRNFRYYGLQMDDDYASYHSGPTIYKGESVEGQPFIDLEFKKNGIKPPTVTLSTDESINFVKGVNNKTGKIQNYPLYLNINLPVENSNHLSIRGYVSKGKLDLRNIEFKSRYFNQHSTVNKANFSHEEIKIASITKEDLKSLNLKGYDLNKLKEISKELLLFDRNINNEKEKAKNNTDYKYEPSSFYWKLMDELEVSQPTINSPIPFDSKHIVEKFIDTESKKTGLSKDQLIKIANFLSLDNF